MANTPAPFDPYAYAASLPDQPAAKPAFDPYAYAASLPENYDPLAAKAAQGQPPASGYDPLAWLAAGKSLPAANASSSSPKSSSTPTWEQDWMTHGNPVDQFVQGAFDKAITSVGGAIGGGLKGLWDIATGRKQAAASDVEQIEQRAAYKPQTTAENLGAEAASSNWNPLNWPGIAISKTGQFLGDTAERLGAPPWLSTALDLTPAAAVSVAGLKAAGIGPGEAYVPEVERVAPEGASDTQSVSARSVGRGALPQGAPEPDGAPVEGGYPQEAQDARAAILSRVGLKTARESAIQGNAKDAASDVQMTKYDQPAGRAAAAQFAAERDALAAHTENIIGETGGTVGMDEDALANRGATIARPFDQLREWFDQRQKELYSQAQARSDELAANGNPTAYTQFRGVDKLLRSPDFRNTLMARDQGNLLNAVSSQLDRFRETNPNGFTPAAAEQFRQWLNQVWSPDNRWAVGQMKGAVDDDVVSTAGNDLYAQARAIRALKARTLENPKGISSLFDTDPNTPINRTTPIEKIPGTLDHLPIDQFANLLQTLHDMPPEIQPDAQAALGEIRGHLVNKLLQAGTQTASGGARGLWNADRVANVLRTNAAKFRVAFQDDPKAQEAIKDLNSAGQILKADASYPGADAQAANAMKRGLVSRTLRHVGGAAGAAAGGLAGPAGAAVGGVLGEMGGEAMGAKGAEAAALKAWQKRVRPLPPAGGGY